MSQLIKYFEEELTKVKIDRNYLQEQNFKCERCDYEKGTKTKNKEPN